MSKLDQNKGINKVNNATKNGSNLNEQESNFNKINVCTQQLTIQDAYDPKDNVTVHANNSYLLLENQIQTKNNITKPSFQKFSKLYSINKLEKSGSTNTSSYKHPAVGFNFFSNNYLNLNIKGKHAVLTGKNSSSNSALNSSYSANDLSTTKNSYGKVYRNVNLNDTKYIEYKKRWNEILRKEKKNFENKWLNSNGHSSIQSNKLEDYELKKTLGNGSFGRVILIQHKKTATYYALKVLEKKNVVKSKQVEHTLNEKKIISSIYFPFLVSFITSFKDNANLYIVLGRNY